ncbi:hypothetical protein N9276_00095 [Rhodopirellula sp.]|nr:hypothetical protein [Rhodopirellula sp.]
MHKLNFLSVSGIIALASLVAYSSGGLAAEEPQILQVSGEEAIAPDYSHQRAVDFLDRTSMAWTKKYKCFTCHTNFAHLIAVSELKERPEYFQEVRSELETLVHKRWPEKGPRWDSEVVMAAMTLTVVDKNLGKPLSQSAKIALDKMWQVQQTDGGFDWLKCDWPPMESDDQYGAVVAAVAVSAAPRTYLRQKQVQAGIKRLEAYLNQSKKQELRLHHRAILLWAQSLKAGWLTQKEIDATIGELTALQRPDGGWNTPSLGKWDREDGGVPDVTTSDGYGTGFAVLMLIKAGMDRDDVVIQNGLSWLKKNQRKSGRWYTRSVSRDSRHFLTHAGTAMAIMAIQASAEHEEG